MNHFFTAVTVQYYDFFINSQIPLSLLQHPLFVSDAREVSKQDTRVIKVNWFYIGVSLCRTTSATGGRVKTRDPSNFQELSCTHDPRLVSLLKSLLILILVCCIAVRYRYVYLYNSQKYNHTTWDHRSLVTLPWIEFTRPQAFCHYAPLLSINYSKSSFRLSPKT
jgi:hypothetical protein